MKDSTDIILVKGDITQMEVEAIVNAANSSILGGGGVDGAIHRAGGPQILAECKAIRAKQGGCETGNAVYTTAGNLPAKYIIHAVGPIWKGGTSREPQLLSNCYYNSLLLAASLHVTSIAFPNISTGVYHFPKQEAAVIAIGTIRDFLVKEDNNLNKIYLVCFDDENYQIYSQLLERR
jgi:O-acetyl-ADP-ribose deacetylase (regulator of RNase III)